MTADQRFAALMRRDEEDVAIDEASLVIAAHVTGVTDVDRFLAEWLGALDSIADRCPSPTVDGVANHLFVHEAFAGNREDYYDPRNSYLHDVLERRLGIPITLAVVALAVGRRLRVPLVGVGMPGHFLLGSDENPDHFVDPFEAGALLDRAGCERRFRAVHGPEAKLDEHHLAPVGPHAICARILANLKHAHLSGGDRRALVRVLELRVMVPGVPSEERKDLASALVASGRFLDGGGVLDELAALEDAAGDGVAADAARQRAIRLRARLN